MEKIRIQLNDKRYLIIQSHSDYFLISITKSNVRLGFIDIVLEYYKTIFHEILDSSDYNPSRINSSIQIITVNEYRMVKINTI